MSQKTDIKQKWAVASYALQDAYTDFILSRQAMLCSPKTIRFYHFTAGRFVKYLEENGVIEPEGVSARYIRAYLASLAAQELRVVSRILCKWNFTGATGLQNGWLTG